MRGSRVQSVVNELSGEKIDIIHWSEDIAALVVSTLAPAEIQKVIIDDPLNVSVFFFFFFSSLL
jgi:N utilization substance protein A